jgi:carbon-monoxide dehydrogenase large subunit
MTKRGIFLYSYGAPAAVMNALNDALTPFNARVTAVPLTPQKILEALGTLSP